MFWIGAAAGAFACLLAIVVGISAIAYGVGKERAKAVEDREKTYEFWETANRTNREKVDIMADILTELQSIAKR